MGGSGFLRGIEVHAVHEQIRRHFAARRRARKAVEAFDYAATTEARIGGELVQFHHTKRAADARTPQVPVFANPEPQLSLADHLHQIEPATPPTDTRDP